MRLIGRNTQGVRLIRVEEGDAVSSLARMPEEELTADVEDVALGAEGDAHIDGQPPHILDDGVGPADASDHIDEEPEETV